MQKQYPLATGRRTFIRILYAALISTLVIGSSGQITPVHAAPSAEAVTWYMDIASPKTKICAGETVEYLATVHYNYNAGESEWALPGVKVEATSSDTNVGAFKMDTAITGFASADLVTAGFSFTAKKPGRTNLYFEALADRKFTSTYVSFTVPVTVIPCKFKVVTTSQMRACYVGGCINFLGVILGGLVTADETGYIFTGTAPVVWISTSAIPGCGAVNSLGTSQVEMRGNLNESGQLLLKLDYGSVAFSEVITCPTGTGGSNPPISVSPLNITVPSIRGVAVRLKQTLSGGQVIVGSANVYVIPMDGAQ
jgi:hypothetical protein